MHTVLKPSLRIPGAIGVFAAKDLKRGTVLYPSSSSADLLSPNLTQGTASQAKTTAGSLFTPPLSANLLFTPLRRNKISLYEFLLLRAAWATPDQRFVVTHADAGAFLVMPRSVMPPWVSTPPSVRDPVDTSILHQLNAKSKVKRRIAFIAEDQFFHLNEAFPFPLPPTDDLASPAYWTSAKVQCLLYKQIVTDGAVSNLLQTDPNSTSREEAAVVTRELQMYSANCRLGVRIPRRKNNNNNDSNKDLNQISRRRLYAKSDMQSGIPYLQLLRPVQQGEELTIHYGLEWWAQYLLSRVFLAATDAQLGKVRWIEALVAKWLGNGPNDGAPSDSALLSESLSPGTLKSSNNNINGNRKDEGEDMTKSSSPSTATGDQQKGVVESGFPLLKLCWCRKSDHRLKKKKKAVDVASVLERRVATNEELLAFAIRRSCQSAAFLKIIAQFGFYVERSNHPPQTQQKNSSATDSLSSPSRGETAVDKSADGDYQLASYDTLRELVIRALIVGDEALLEQLITQKESPRKGNDVDAEDEGVDI